MEKNITIHESIKKAFGTNWTPPAAFSEGTHKDHMDALAFAAKHIHNIPAAAKPQPGKKAPLHIEVRVTDMDEYKETLKVMRFCLAHMRPDHKEMAERMLERIYDK